MANAAPLFERVAITRPIDAVLDAAICFLLISLLAYRLLFLCNHGFSFLHAAAFLCESWFTFISLLHVSIKFNPVRFTTYPHRLRLLKRAEDLPRVDVFVTTADPTLEPPIITVNTVLSVLALDYPANKLACYVSDDACSPLTFYSLTQALKFAQIWVPFCRKYGVQVRAPFRYFSGSYSTDDGESAEFRREWKEMKVEYEKLCSTIGAACQIPASDSHVLVGGGDHADFSAADSKNHAPVVKILWENKEGHGDEVPHLVYVSREKRPKYSHNFKAGAMNVLTRVSGLMTNAPYILNVDCDVFVNDSSAILQAICALIDPRSDEEVAFVQFPQRFYGGSKHDLYGNHFLVFMESIVPGLAGSQGPSYMGTGCIHRRKVLYGQLPNQPNINGKFSETKLFKKFGYSEDFIKSATSALMGAADGYPYSLQYPVEALNKVAGCGYEYDTCWGVEVGLYYGSATEDIFTGMMIQSQGWKSIYLNPNPPAFLGCAPTSGPATFTQLKRWMTGFLEIFFSKNCPIFAALFGKLHLRLCMFYVWIYLWGISSIPELCYAALPAYCLITNSRFLPELQEREIFIPFLLFVLYNIQQVLLYLKTGQSIRAYWNNQRMARINTMCAYLFGVMGIVLKFLGLSETIFEVTKKESSCSSDGGETDENSGQFTFDKSPLFVPGTTVLMMQLTGLFMSIWRWPAKAGEVGEVTCSVWLVLCFMPFLKGMFGKGRYGIPFSTMCKSSSLTMLFVYLSLKTVM
ncbi:cellulose synthase-like protein H1 isoform X1 [Momordica charantia]|uniref:Cellulose synthase-like protein H1 isoform X1 n=1 Tax=Momordica charantia TaxID=3673 RepID=A0A6J1CIB7_MOMCH|nr:cellulose synthase-like protein H1 isoform X1 [Momordica charantia]